jgi:hypothetical protein
MKIDLATKKNNTNVPYVNYAAVGLNAVKKIHAAGMHAQLTGRDLEAYTVCGKGSPLEADVEHLTALLQRMLGEG